MEDTFKEHLNIDNEVEDEIYEDNDVLQNCQSLVLYHQHRLVDETVPDKTVYLNDYWQLRHSRSQCTDLRNGWDGTPEEIQAGFCRHTYQQVVWLSDSDGSTTVPDDVSVADWSTDEEGMTAVPL